MKKFLSLVFGCLIALPTLLIGQPPTNQQPPAYNGQYQVSWYAYMYTPLIRGSMTYTNDSTVAQLLTVEAKAGYTYIIQEIPPSDSVLIQAGTFVAQQGVITGPTLGGIDRPDWIKYTVNVKKPRTKLTYRYSMANASTGEPTGIGQVQFRTGSITGPVFATIDLPPTGSWSVYGNASVPINFGSADVNVDIYLTFTGSPRVTGSGGNLVWFSFK